MALDPSGEIRILIAHRRTRLLRAMDLETLVWRRGSNFPLSSLVPPDVFALPIEACGGSVSAAERFLTPLGGRTLGRQRFGAFAGLNRQLLFALSVAAAHHNCPESVSIWREGDRARTRGGILGKGVRASHR
jgi:hypothetical protein